MSAVDGPKKPLAPSVSNTNYLGHVGADTESLMKADATVDNWLVAVLNCFGPGLMLGLANSNAGDLLVAAQSGAQFRFLDLAWVTLLMVPLYISCELVTRICVLNNTPLLVMINDARGTTLSVMSIFVLVVSCTAGLTMQTCTSVAVGEIWGVGGLPVCFVITAMCVSIVLTDSVSRMDKFCMCLGLFEVSVSVSAFLAKPKGEAMADAYSKFGDTLWLDHATITGAITGAVLMPWMFFYLGSAVNRNKITECHLKPSASTSRWALSQAKEPWRASWSVSPLRFPTQMACIPSFHGDPVIIERQPAPCEVFVFDGHDWRFVRGIPGHRFDHLMGF